MGPSGGLLGASWARLGASWAHPGASWGFLGGLLGGSWGPLGRVLGPLGRVLGLPGPGGGSGGRKYRKNHVFSHILQGFRGVPGAPQNLSGRLRRGNRNAFWAGVPRAHSSRIKHLASSPHSTILEFQTISPKKARILEHLTTRGYEATTYMDSTFYEGSLRSLVAPPQGGDRRISKSCSIMIISLYYR